MQARLDCGGRLGERVYVGGCLNLLKGIAGTGVYLIKHTKEEREQIGCKLDPCFVLGIV